MLPDFVRPINKKSNMELKEQFEKAAKESKQLPSKPDNETLLKLYSFYKQGTEGDVNTDPPSNPFDFVNKAKHEAWTSIKGKSKDEAMQEYVALVEKLKG
jgi:diazepam-binding inhibitor (GABA receptor modulator, acyl-CoA-binding protein)